MIFLNHYNYEFKVKFVTIIIYLWSSSLLSNLFLLFFLFYLTNLTWVKMDLLAFKLLLLVSFVRNMFLQLFRDQAWYVWWMRFKLNLLLGCLRNQIKSVDAHIWTKLLLQLYMYLCIDMFLSLLLTSKADKVTTISHSQGIRFLTHVTGTRLSSFHLCLLKLIYWIFLFAFSSSGDKRFK